MPVKLLLLFLLLLFDIVSVVVSEASFVADVIFIFIYLSN